MTQPIESRCLRCGRPDEGEGPRCPCGASLLVDVVLAEPAPEERTRFQLARALAVLGAPVPPFAELRKELERADGRVVRGVSRVFAQRVVEVLATQGAGAELRPAKDGAGLPGWLPLAAGGLALVALGVGAVTLKPRTPEAAPSFIGGEDAGTRAQAVAPVERTTQDISQTSLPGTVSLRCEGSTGAGFFVGEELVLTNAHVACERGKFMEVTLADGRRVLGETLERDETLDLATVRVSGARAEPLPLGDATRLSPGDRLVFIGSPKGLSFTVHEGKVSHLGREYLGVGYVQFDASINPGNSGGPLLNERGEVVGVVSLKVNNAEGIGLALPIQYASKLLKVPATPDAEERWTALLTKVGREEERALRQYQLEENRPALVGLEEVANVGLAVAVLERFASAPSGRSHRFELQSDEGRCGMDVEFERWRPLVEAVKEEEHSRRLRWLVSKGLAQGLYVGVARLPVEGCALTGTGPVWLTVEGGDAELKAKLELAAVEKARALVKGRQPSRDRMISLTGEAMRERREQVDTHNREAAASWSNAFRQAQTNLQRLEEQRRKYAQQYATGYNVRGNLDEVDRELKRARERLDDLEREASNAGIPREWRR